MNRKTLVDQSLLDRAPLPDSIFRAQGLAGGEGSSDAGVRGGDLARLLGYGYQYYGDHTADVADPAELALVLVVPTMTRALARKSDADAETDTRHSVFYSSAASRPT